MNTAMYSSPVDRLQNELRRIDNLACKLLEGKDKFILPEKISIFNRRVESQAEYKELCTPSKKDLGSFAIFIGVVVSAIRSCSNGNWKQVAVDCENLFNDTIKLKRMQELFNPPAFEDFRDLENFYTFHFGYWQEVGTHEDLKDLRQFQKKPTVVSEKVSRAAAGAVKGILGRATNLAEINPWMAACLHELTLSEEEELGLLDEILHASENEIPLLMELADARQCQGIFRRVAMYRLVELEPDQNTCHFLRILFDVDEPDEDLRVLAYEAYLYLRFKSGNLRSQAERNEERGRIESDPSPHMRWLMSLED